MATKEKYVALMNPRAKEGSDDLDYCCSRIIRFKNL